MYNVYYESLLLEQQINYFILESNYESICEAEQKKSILERIKDFLDARIEKVLSILKAIKEFIVKLFTKIIPSTYKYIKMHLKDKLKNKNKEYTTIDIYAIKENISILKSVDVYWSNQFTGLESSTYLIKDLINSRIDDETFDKKYGNIKTKVCTPDYQYFMHSSKYCNLSELDQIKISYKEIKELYEGTPELSRFKGQMIDKAMKRMEKDQRDFNDAIKEASELDEDKKSVTEKRIQKLSSLASQNTNAFIKFLNQYKNDIAANVSAYNNYFTKYLTELDKAKKDEIVDSSRKYLDSLFGIKDGD